MQITGGITNVIFKARNGETGEGALVRVYGKDTDLLLDRRYVVCVSYGGFRVDIVLFLLAVPTKSSSFFQCGGCL